MYRGICTKFVHSSPVKRLILYTIRGLCFDGRVLIICEIGSGLHRTASPVTPTLWLTERRNYNTIKNPKRTQTRECDICRAIMMCSRFLPEKKITRNKNHIGNFVKTIRTRPLVRKSHNIIVRVLYVTCILWDRLGHVLFYRIVVVSRHRIRGVFFSL